MKADIKYITQISASDLKEIAGVVNMETGDGIQIDRSQSGLRISVDKQAIRMWVQTIINGGQI